MATLKGLIDHLQLQMLVRWYNERNDRLEARAVGWPACWGGQYRVNEFGDYVPKDVFYEVLPTEHDRNLFYCCCDCYADDHWSEVAKHAHDDAWLERTAYDYACSDRAVVYYTEGFPFVDFTYGELVELAQERPDLFTQNNLDEWPDLVKPALNAGIDCTFGGEPAWYCGLPGFHGLHKLSELRECFANGSQFPHIRATSSTFETWVADLERLGILEKVPGSAYRSPSKLAEEAGQLAAVVGDDAAMPHRAVRRN